ncbi:MAG: UvrB/UvrC motif-containing protein [Kiritimatiellia bacterium]
MKCDICHENPATLHFKQIVEGGARELHMCEQCAGQYGLDSHSPASLTDFFFGMAKQMAKAEKKCPVCNMGLSDYRRTSRLGCATCYETFAAELSSLIASIHPAMQHRGKVPVSQQVSVRVAGLRRQLEKAVEKQNFEEAARLRDQIRELMAGQENRKEGHAGSRS